MPWLLSTRRSWGDHGKTYALGLVLHPVSGDLHGSGKGTDSDRYWLSKHHYKCKLLVVPDSHHAYTWIFHIRYEDKSPVAQIQPNNGWSYKAVIALVDDKVLGSVPIPFWDLLEVNIWDAFHKSSSTNCPEMQPVEAWNESEITNFSSVNGRTRKVLMWSSYSANGDRGCDQVTDNGQKWLFQYMLQYETATSE